MAYYHGVYTSEQDTSLTVPLEATAGLQVVFGTAPIYMVDDASAVTTPQICYSYDEAVAAVGYSEDFDKFTLCQAIKASFDVFNVGPIILVNVLDPTDADHVTTVSDAEQTIGETFTLLDGSGTTAYYAIKSTLALADQDGTTLEADTDYTVEYGDDGSCEVTLTSDTALAATSITASYKAITTTDGVTALEGSTGVTASEIVTAINKVREIYPRFGMTPGLLLAPGWSTNADVATKLQSACEDINGVFTCECIVDIPSDSSGATDYADVKSVKEAQGLTSEHCIACWPKVVSGSYTFDYSAVLGALMAYTDANNDDIPNLSPSNKSMSGITGTVLADGTEIILDQEQANLVNSYGVVTALNMNGYRAWGNNTCVYPSSTDPKDRWIMVRRFFSWRRNSIILTYFQKVDNPANYRLIESIMDTENIQGNAYVAAGVCAGYTCEFLADENPITQILDGKIVFHLSLAPYTPAENIHFTLEFDPDAIETALTGGDD